MTWRRSLIWRRRPETGASGRRSPRRLGRPSDHGRWSGDAGAVLLEAAIAIPLLLAVTLCLAWAVALAGTSMALGDAVRQSARDVARGIAVSDALDSARAAAPDAELRIEQEGESMVVVAEQQVSAPGPILKGISVTVTQRVAMPVEWSQGAP